MNIEQETARLEITNVITELSVTHMDSHTHAHLYLHMDKYVCVGVQEAGTLPKISCTAGRNVRPTNLLEDYGYVLFDFYKLISQLSLVLEFKGVPKHTETNYVPDKEFLFSCPAHLV